LVAVKKKGNDTMATEALTSVAKRGGRELVVVEQEADHKRGWQELFAAEQMETIWEKLFKLVQATVVGDVAECEGKTQQVFLQLLVNGSFSRFVCEGFTDERIYLELLSTIKEQVEASAMFEPQVR
jgi:hypothetical protein